MKYNKLILSLLSLFLVLPVWAQETYRVNNKNSRIIVKGTSSLHDWEMIAEEMTAELRISKDGNQLNTINNASFSMESENLLSDNSIMNNKTHDALKSGKYEKIRFDLESVSGIQGTGGIFSGTASGNLFIAGTTKKVYFPFKGSIDKTGIVTISGQEKLKMTEFGVDPPTAMLGTLKTGDEIEVKFDLEFIK